MAVQPGRTVPVEADVVVMGSGAAGMSAALAARAHGAEVVLLEKGPLVGGTTALSAGVVWIPVNRAARDAGVQDSAADAVRYILSLSNDRQDPDAVRAFVEAAPQIASWLEDNTELSWVVIPYPDYHSENPGALGGGGRSLAEAMFPFRTLGEWADRVVLSPGQHERMRLTPAETVYGGAGGGPSAETLARREADDMRGWGQALAGSLLGALLARGVEPVVSTRVTELLTDGGGGAVVGVRAEGPDGPLEVRARGGVVIASGGFDWNPELVRTFLRGPLQNSVAVRENVGDGLAMVRRVDADLGTMQEAYWTPLIKRPGDVRRGDGVFPRSATVVAERSRPGSILVNRAGKRFCNEATNYNAVVGAFHAIDPATLEFVNLPAYLVFDQAFRDRGPVADCVPGDPVPDWMVSAPTLEKLAARIGVDPEGLGATVERFNILAEQGHDEDFGRGGSRFERANGDARAEGARANLGPVAAAPFYAVEIEVGAFGTRGGPRTDGVGRVLRGGTPVPGLYAAGNAAASVMGMAYPGGGSTLGPALTFGHLAGRDAASRAGG